MDGEVLASCSLTDSFFICVIASLWCVFWNRTPLHCAASCNSVHLCKLLVESGAAIFASTISDVETAADKCEEMEEGYIQCSQFLYGKNQPKVDLFSRLESICSKLYLCLMI